MRNKYFYNDNMEYRGRGRRGRGHRMGRGGAYGPRAAVIDTDEGFGPPPWAGRGGRWADEMPNFPETADDFVASRMRGMGRRMWSDIDISVDERRAWLLARKARLLARKQHIEDRLAETEAALAALDEPDSGPDPAQND
jgi:hypothetical protein